MTGFSQKIFQKNSEELTIEIKSINHRYLDLHFTLPETLGHLEFSLREQIKAHFNRGKIDVFVRHHKNIEQKNFALDSNFLKKIIQISKEIQHEFDQNLTINPIDFLNYPGVIHYKNEKDNALETWFLSCFVATLEDIKESREREGSGILKHLQTLSQSLKEHITSISSKTVELKKFLQDRLLQRLSHLEIKVDGSRLEQEMVFLFQKHDVEEEIQRLQSHSQELHRILNSQTLIGKKLEFLLQEFIREFNTFLAKIPNQTMIYSVLEGKLLVEQIREQIQNVE